MVIRYPPEDEIVLTSLEKELIVVAIVYTAVAYWVGFLVGIKYL